IKSSTMPHLLPQQQRWQPPSSFPIFLERAPLRVKSSRDVRFFVQFRGWDFDRLFSYQTRVFYVSSLYQNFEIMQFFIQKLFKGRMQEPGNAGTHAAHYRMRAKHHTDQGSGTVNVIIKLHLAGIFYDSSFLGSPANQFARNILYDLSFPSDRSMVTG